MSKLIFKRAALYAVIGIGVGLFPQMTFASSITGTLNLAGTITVSSANGGTINFIPLVAGQSSTFVVLPSSGSFGILAGDVGSESASLNGIAEPVNTQLASMVTGFLTIPQGGLTFDLTEVLGPSTAGESPCTLTTTTGECFVAGTPFNFATSSGGSSAATFAVLGNLNYNGLSAKGVTLAFSATFVGETIGQVLNDFLTTGSAMQSSSGQVIVNVVSNPPPTPEPGTMTMLLTGVGLMTAAVFTRKRKSVLR
jgi:hypothetical protein